jgi:hypothetical protein
MKKKIFGLIFICLFLFTGSSVAVNIARIKFNDNTPPNPPIIFGPINGKIRQRHLYNITVTDPDEDDKLLKLEVDFGDGIVQEDCGCNTPWENGEIIQMEHIWKKQGTYKVTGRVADEHNEWSQWSEPIIVTMQKNKISLNAIINKLLVGFSSSVKFLNLLIANI